MRDNHFALRPESIRSSELVWEEYLSSWLRTAVTGFRYHIDDVIELRTQSSDGLLFFANGADITGRGLEMEVEARGRGVTTSWSHTYVQARARGGTEISNSPSHLSKFQVQFEVSSVVVAADLQYLGSRRVRSGDRLGPALIPNFTISRPITRRLELSASVYNASSSAYADPTGEDHVQPAIPQDGATALLRARLRF
jgi:iron complex outermembrane receptor protein